MISDQRQPRGLLEGLAPGATPGWATVLCGGFLVGEGPRAGEGSCGATASASPQWVPPDDGRLCRSSGPLLSTSSQKPRPWVPSGLGGRVCVTEAERGTAAAQDRLSPALRGALSSRGVTSLSIYPGSWLRSSGGQSSDGSRACSERGQGQCQHRGHRCDRRPPACAGSPCGASGGVLCPGAVGEPGLPPGHRVDRWEDPKVGRKPPGMGDSRGTTSPGSGSPPRASPGGTQAGASL